MKKHTRKSKKIAPPKKNWRSSKNNFKVIDLGHCIDKYCPDWTFTDGKADCHSHALCWAEGASPDELVDLMKADLVALGFKGEYDFEHLSRSEFMRRLPFVRSEVGKL